MAKRRTKKDKIKASNRHVNTQLAYTFDPAYNFKTKINKTVITEYSKDVASIKKDLIKSLIVALLITVSLVVIYLLS